MSFVSLTAFPCAAVSFQDVKSRIESFLDVSLTEVEKRLPPVTGVFRALSSLKPTKVLSQMDRAPFDSLPFAHLRQSNMDMLEQQYRQMLHVDWKEELGGPIPGDTVAFWAVIAKYETMNSHPFKDLAEYALACLSTPVSNAVVERVFSQVTAVKTKTRNRMTSSTLSAIVRIRAHLHFRGICCRQFVPTQDMLRRFNTADMYGRGEDRSATAASAQAEEDAEESDLWLW